MRNRTSSLLVLVACALALLGGAAAGMLAMRLSPSSNVSSLDHTLLGDELQLTTSQRDQIRAIWEHVRQTAADATAEGQRLESDWEARLKALLTPDQKKEYEQIHRDYNDGVSALKSRQEKAMADAIERTRDMLNETQRRKYDVILAHRLGPMHGGRHVTPGLLGGPPGPATQPATTEPAVGPTAAF